MFIHIMKVVLLGLIVSSQAVMAQEGHFFGGGLGGPKAEKKPQQETPLDANGRPLVNVFHVTDSDGTGTIDQDEYADYLVAGFNAVAGEIGELSWIQLRDIIEGYQGNPNSEVTDKIIGIRMLFSMGDRNSDDRISYEELTASAPLFFDSLDQNRDNSLSEEEFANEVLRIILPLMSDQDRAAAFFGGI